MPMSASTGISCCAWASNCSRLRVAGAGLHVYRRIPRRSIVRERRVAQVVPRADRSLDARRLSCLAHVARDLGRVERRLRDSETLGELSGGEEALGHRRRTAVGELSW